MTVTNDNDKWSSAARAGIVLSVLSEESRMASHAVRGTSHEGTSNEIDVDIDLIT
jgi:hypothetical protein